MGVERNGREWLVFRNSPRDHDDREKCKNFGKRQNKLHTQRDSTDVGRRVHQLYTATPLTDGCIPVGEVKKESKFNTMTH